MQSDFNLLSRLADHLEKSGNFEKAWIVVAELASSLPPRHPFHTRLLVLETLLQERQHPTTTTSQPAPSPKPQ